MKRRDLIRHLKAHGYDLLREVSRHTIYVSRANQTVSAIPRYQEINHILAQKICRDLGVPDPSHS
ncbi:MAG: addiction module toxin, HicA family [Armatimonadota bacterium]|nr:addiction module toxin, HicA family [Armatimonadota bacterium]